MLKTYDEFNKFNSLWIDFINQINAISKNIVFEKDEYLDSSILLSSSHSPPVVNKIPKKVLSPNSESKKYTNCYHFSKSIEGFSNVLGSFHPDAINEFLSLHKGLSLLLKQKSALAAQDFYTYALDNAQSHQNVNGNIWFERVVEQLKERAPNLDFRSYQINRTVFSALVENNLICEAKILHKHGCRFDVSECKKSFSFENVIKSNPSFNPHYKIKDPQLLETLLECGVCIKHFNWAKKYSSQLTYTLTIKEKDEHFRWILNSNCPTLPLLETFLKTHYFKEENEKLWHQNTVASPLFKAHISTKNKENVFVYLEYLVKKYPSEFLEWPAPNKKAMHQFLIDEGFSEFVDYANLLKNKNTILNSPEKLKNKRF